MRKGLMKKFSTNIKGRVDETKVAYKEGYFALLEAISNSIHAIAERNIVNGKIIIRLERVKLYQESGIEKIDTDKLPIENIIIEDNGIGFNEDNFNSFMRCNSEYKKSRFGAKGVGRFTWLKVFDEVQVESVYTKGDSREKINFVFRPVDEIYDDYGLSDQEIKTIVKLTNMKDIYRIYFPQDIQDIAKIIINHFFLNFIRNEIPIIEIIDNTQKVNVNKKFNNLKDFQIYQSSIKIFTEDIVIYHIKTTNLDNANKLFLCANTRVVEIVDLRKFIKNLQSSIGKIGSKKVWYFGYVCANYLDDIVNSERTQLNFPQEDGDMPNCINITKNTFLSKVCKEISLYLEKDIDKIEKEKRAQIDFYIDTKRPNYKNLRHFRPDFYKNIENNLSEDKLELALYKEKMEWNKEIDEQYKLIKKKAKFMDIDKLDELKREYLINISQYGKDCLAEYIVKRKSILDMLDNYISKDENEKYSLEETVHSLICPLRATSEQLNYNDMNLWLIDEKLAYHYYLASDKTMKSQLVEGDLSNKETDIAIYNNPLLFNDTIESKGYISLTIIEFKKPMRDNYSDDSNPIEQVYGYIEEIRSGRKMDRRGRPLQGDLKNMPIYSYIIADITPSLEKQCKMANLSRLPSDDGFFGYSQEYKTFVQVISYNKLKRDAELRNQVLFDTLFGKIES